MAPPPETRSPTASRLSKPISCVSGSYSSTTTAGKDLAVLASIADARDAEHTPVGIFRIFIIDRSSHSTASKRRN